MKTTEEIFESVMAKTSYDLKTDFLTAMENYHAQFTNPNSGALDRNILIKLIANNSGMDEQLAEKLADAIIPLLPKQEIKYPTEPQIGDMLHKENLLGCGRPYLTADRTIDLIKSLNP